MVSELTVIQDPVPAAAWMILDAELQSWTTEAEKIRTEKIRTEKIRTEKIRTEKIRTEATKKADMLQWDAVMAILIATINQKSKPHAIAPMAHASGHQLRKDGHALSK